MENTTTGITNADQKQHAQKISMVTHTANTDNLHHQCAKQLKEQHNKLLMVHSDMLQTSIKTSSIIQGPLIYFFNVTLFK